MYKRDSIITKVLFLATSIFFYLGNKTITEPVAQNLVTFLSIAFGFYTATISVLHYSQYTKRLYQPTDRELTHLSQIHVLRNYFQYAGYTSVGNIACIIAYQLVADIQPDTGQLTLEFLKYTVPAVNYTLDFGPVVSSALLGLVSVNFFFILIIFRILSNSLVEEAKK